MKRFLSSGARLPRRDRLQMAILINQLATPGLGSWVAGHRLAGAGQLTLACAGFAWFLVYFFLLIREYWRALDFAYEPHAPPEAILNQALILFGVAWLWSGITSLQCWLELRRTPRGTPGEPPRLPD